MRHFLIVAALLSLCASCASTPPPMVADPSNVGIALSLHQPDYWSLSTVAFCPETVYFIRLANDKDTNYKTPTLFASNHKCFSGENVVFALNLPPGEYAPVAAAGYDNDSDEKYVEDMRKVVIFFPKELIESTRTVVANGTVVYLGEIYLQTLWSMKGADDVQKYYYRLFSGNERRPGDYMEMLFLRKFVSNYTIYIAPKFQGVAKSKQLQKDFLTRYLAYFKGSGWNSHFNKRLAELEK
ncbi:MAG: hypothetical protein AB2L13_10955 [Spirochaetota bacterium]